MKSVLLLLSLYFCCIADAQVITTYAGNDTLWGVNCNACPATASGLQMPQCARPDATGNVFIADQGDNMIRMVSPAGLIYTVAGNGMEVHSGDGGPATAAGICRPGGVAFDLLGNLYIAESTDTFDNGPWIRKVNTSGIITTFAGCGINGYAGDGGPALGAGFVGGVMDIEVGPTGVIYIADAGNQRIRKINPDGIISTYAGNGTSGFSGDGGPATNAQIYGPQALATDTAGNLYIADYGNNRLRKVSPDGIIHTIAGNGGLGSGGDGNPATVAALGTPDGVAVDKWGNIYISEYNRYRVRKISTSDTITTIAGSGNSGYSGDGGPATDALLFAPSGVGVDIWGNIYISDIGNNNVRKIFVDRISHLSVAHLNNNVPEMHIWPVPNNGSFSISFLPENYEPKTIIISNITGQRIKEISTMDNQVNVILDGIPGIYIVMVISGKQNQVTRVVIQ